MHAFTSLTSRLLSTLASGLNRYCGYVLYGGTGLALAVSTLAIVLALLFGFAVGGAESTSALPQLFAVVKPFAVQVPGKLMTAGPLALLWLVPPIVLLTAGLSFAVGLAQVVAGDAGPGFSACGMALLLGFVALLATGALMLVLQAVTKSLGLIVATLNWSVDRSRAVAVPPAVQAVTAKASQTGEAAGDRSAAVADIKFPVRPARVSFKDLHGMAALKQVLLAAGKGALESGPSTRNGLLLHGRPGNGKTYMAEALAGELSLPFLSVSIADLQSMWVGETTERLVRVFRDANAQSPCVLLLDEIDSIISSRKDSSSDQEAGRMTNAFLTEVVRCRGRGVVVVACTNFLARLDAAAIRDGRFDHKIEVPSPDLEARVGLVQDTLRSEAPAAHLDVDACRRVVQRWEGFSVARCRAVVLELASSSQAMMGQRLDAENLLTALRNVQSRSIGSSAPVKGLHELSLPATALDDLDGLAWRMATAYDDNDTGVSVPTALVLSGPQGAPLVETVQALASQSAWVCIEANGHELVQSEGAALADLLARAQDERPAVLLVKSAELAFPIVSASPWALNNGSSVVLADYLRSPTPDVTVVLASHHPDLIDPMVTANGRVSDRVCLAPPDPLALSVLVRGWLARKEWRYAGALDLLVSDMHGRSAGEVQAALQTVVNTEVARARRTGEPLVREITRERLLDALRQSDLTGDTN